MSMAAGRAVLVPGLPGAGSASRSNGSGLTVSSRAIPRKTVRLASAGSAAAVVRARRATQSARSMVVLTSTGAASVAIGSVGTAVTV